MLKASCSNGLLDALSFNQQNCPPRWLLVLAGIFSHSRELQYNKLNLRID
jgi:hypothetical protein